MKKEDIYSIFVIVFVAAGMGLAANAELTDSPEHAYAALILVLIALLIQCFIQMFNKK